MKSFKFYLIWLAFVATVLHCTIAGETDENVPSEVEEAAPSVAEQIKEDNTVDIPTTTVEIVDNSNSTKSENSTKKVVVCKPDLGGTTVELVNGTQLLKLLQSEGNSTVGECVFVLFYAKFCRFSAHAAPHFNALPRAFPDVKMVAIDAMQHYRFNTQNGIFGVPTLILFHNGRSVVRYHNTDYSLELFINFLAKHTGLEPAQNVHLRIEDLRGPVPTVPESQTDYYLGLSWIFIVLSCVYLFTTSKYWRWIVENVQNIWREAEAQHQHAD